ncbi:MAG TPA: site-specific DNA-methyltransferase [Acidimicrobiales bacterium]|nr:site-specific DNA-methyltransferase [Acidimicrobiales bacterium]
MTGQPRRRTATSAFGVGRRENHDSSEFYARFRAPEIVHSDEVTPTDIDRLCRQGDSRSMAELPDGCVALVVTSPPYFAGKEYEEALGQGHIPGSYLEYLEMLRAVFAECKRVLEPGGRLAVNVANLGRKPYRSLSSDVVRILEEDLGLLLRGEVIWRKGDGASGSCAWGSFRSAANPVLRDTTERVIIASKGRFDRARSTEDRRRAGLPHASTIGTDEFLEATLDVWTIAPESARRVNHPAPFPVELPQRLIELYTYAGDLVLDPFMGSGTTLVAATRTGRRCAGYDTDAAYVTAARRRIAAEPARPPVTAPTRPARTGARAGGRTGRARVEVVLAAPGSDFQARASREGKAAQAIAQEVLDEVAGFQIVQVNHRLRGLGVTVNFIASDGGGNPWYFDVSGAFTSTRGGLLRTDTVWKSLGRANVLYANNKTPIVLLSTDLPKPRSEGDLAIRGVGPAIVFDVVDMMSEEGHERLRLYAKGDHSTRPEPGYWTAKELARL